MSALDNARANLVRELNEWHLDPKIPADDVVEAIEIFVTALILNAREELK